MMMKRRGWTVGQLEDCNDDEMYARKKELFLNVWSMTVFYDRLVEWMKSISSMILNRPLKLMIVWDLAE